MPIEKGDSVETLRAKSQAINVDIMIEGVELLGCENSQRIKQLKKDGKQYFAMHPRLKENIAKKLIKNN